MADINVHVAAWKAYLATLVTVPVYDRDEVAFRTLQGLTSPTDYLLIDVGYGARGQGRLSSTSATKRQGYFLSIWTVGAFLFNVNRERGQLDVLETRRLLIGSTLTSPVSQAFADDLPERDDAGLWQSRSEWTYVHP